MNENIEQYKVGDLIIFKLTLSDFGDESFSMLKMVEIYDIRYNRERFSYIENNQLKCYVPNAILGYATEKQVEIYNEILKLQKDLKIELESFSKKIKKDL